MTFNGSDFTNFSDQDLQLILNNTIKQGTRFGWEFVSVDNSSSGSFSLYNDDWTPKRVIKMVDEHWGYWLYKIESVEKMRSPSFKGNGSVLLHFRAKSVFLPKSPVAR